MPHERSHYTRRAREKARRYVRAVRDETVCARCGCQPVEFHNPDHKEHPERRVARLVSTGRSIAVIQAEIDRCTPLCPYCHAGEHCGGFDDDGAERRQERVLRAAEDDRRYREQDEEAARQIDAEREAT